MNCHAAENFGPCHEEALYLDWKCKEMKADLFVYMVDNPPCLADLMKYHPTYAEFVELCNAMWNLISIKTMMTMISGIIISMLFI